MNLTPWTKRIALAALATIATTALIKGYQDIAEKCLLVAAVLINPQGGD